VIEEVFEVKGDDVVGID